MTPLPFPLDSLLHQGAVFLHRNFKFPESSKPKFLVYLSSPSQPEPLLFVLTTTDKNRKIPYFPQARQDDIFLIPAGELEFFQSSDATFIDLNNHRLLEKPEFKSQYDEGIIEYKGRIREEHLKQLIEKTKDSKILQPDVKKRIVGY